MIPGACWDTEKGNRHSHTEGIVNLMNRWGQSYQQSSKKFYLTKMGKERYERRGSEEAAAKKNGDKEKSKCGQTEPRWVKWIVTTLHFQFSKAGPKPTTNSNWNEAVNQWPAVCEQCWTGCFQGETHITVDHKRGKTESVCVCVCVCWLCPLRPVAKRGSDDHCKLG